MRASTWKVDVGVRVRGYRSRIILDVGLQRSSISSQLVHSSSASRSPILVQLATERVPSCDNRIDPHPSASLSSIILNHPRRSSTLAGASLPRGRT
jgi:hypothetical protein